MLSYPRHSQHEREEFETDYKQKYERERVLMMEENKKISSELDNVSILLMSVCPIVTAILFVPQTHTDLHILSYFPYIKSNFRT